MSHRPPPRIQVLARRNTSGELSGATSARCAAELARKHGAGDVPQEAVDAVVSRFSAWLRLACEATRTAAPEPEDADEGERLNGHRGATSPPDAQPSPLSTAGSGKTRSAATGRALWRVGGNGVR